MVELEEDGEGKNGSGARFSTKYTIVFADTDTSGIVHFSNYFRFFERAEEEYLRRLGLRYPDLAARYKIWMPRVFASCEYLSPCRDGDEVEITLSLKELREKSVAESFEVRNNTTGKLAAKGELVNAAASLDVSRSVPLPRELADLFSKRVTTGEANREGGGSRI